MQEGRTAPVASKEDEIEKLLQHFEEQGDRGGRRRRAGRRRRGGAEQDDDLRRLDALNVPSHAFRAARAAIRARPFAIAADEQVAGRSGRPSQAPAAMTPRGDDQLGVHLAAVASAAAARRGQDLVRARRAGRRRARLPRARGRRGPASGLAGRGDRERALREGDRSRCCSALRQEKTAGRVSSSRAARLPSSNEDEARACASSGMPPPMFSSSAQLPMSSKPASLRGLVQRLRGARGGRALVVLERGELEGSASSMSLSMIDALMELRLLLPLRDRRPRFTSLGDVVRGHRAAVAEEEGRSGPSRGRARWR